MVIPKNISAFLRREMGGVIAKYFSYHQLFDTPRLCLGAANTFNRYFFYKSQISITLNK